MELPSDTRAYFVELTHYSPAWVDHYNELVAEIRTSCPGITLQVESIGSRLVPGALSKPILDVMIECPEVAQVTLIETLLAGGFVRLDMGLSDRVFMRRLRQGDIPPAHLHLVTPAVWATSRERRFRDLLLANHSLVEAYSCIKRLIVDSGCTDSSSYRAAKSQFIHWAIDLIEGGANADETR